MKIGVSNDHAAVELKKEVVKYLEDKYGYEVVDYGTNSNDSCNYAEYGEKLANAIVAGEVEKGIAICGTGIGISIACNKVNGIRCAVCSEEFSARLSKQHNDSNILAFGARVVDTKMAKKLIDAWLEAEFEGGRHQARIDYFKEIEKKQK